MMGIESLFQSVKGIGIFAIFLSILIVVHEWGHFITAKKLGVKVEKFSLGFGKVIFKKTYNGTLFLLSIIPLGGYVKMAGDERDQCKGAPDEFFSKSVGARSLIIFNGPMVNFVLAYICFVFVFMLGFPEVSTRVGELIDGQAAQLSELKVGDEIIAVDGNKIYGWTELQNAVAKSKNFNIVLTVLRSSRELDVVIIPQMRKRPNMLGQIKEMRSIGISPYGNEIGLVDDDGLAKNIGLMVGDSVIAVKDIPTVGWSEVEKQLSNIKDGDITITIMRDGQTMTMVATPKTIQKKTLFGLLKKEVKVSKLGIAPKQEQKSYQFSPGESIVRGFLKLKEITFVTYKALGSMIIGTISAKDNMAGPIGIFYIVTSAADLGIAHFLYILGVVSASLAIFNLFPVIPLDGGHLFLLGIEKIRGKALSAKIDEWISRIGFSMIIMLALFVFYSDISRYWLN